MWMAVFAAVRLTGRASTAAKVLRVDEGTYETTCGIIPQKVRKNPSSPRVLMAVEEAITAAIHKVAEHYP